MVACNCHKGSADIMTVFWGFSDNLRSSVLDCWAPITFCYRHSVLKKLPPFHLLERCQVLMILMKRWNRWNIFIPVKLHTFHYFSNCMYYRSNYTSVCQTADECVCVIAGSGVYLHKACQGGFFFFFACLMLPPTASIQNIYYPIITRGPHTRL